MPSGRCLPSAFGMNVRRTGFFAVDTSSFGVLPPLRPATSPRRTPQCPGTSGGPLRAPRRWRGSAPRLPAGRRPGTPCRTARRSGTAALPSLWHATRSATSEHSVGLIGSSPILRSLVAFHVVLELRSLRSTGITRFRRYYEPLRPPLRPGLPLTGFRLPATPRHRAEFLCLRWFPGGHAVATTPAETNGLIARSSPDKVRRHTPVRWQPSLSCMQVGFRINRFEACSAFTHVTACPLAEPPSGPLTSEASAHRRSDCFRLERPSCRAGLAPAENQHQSQRTARHGL